MLLVRTQASRKHGYLTVAHLVQRKPGLYPVRGPHMSTSNRGVPDNSSLHRNSIRSQVGDSPISSPKPGDVVMAHDGLNGALAEVMRKTNLLSAQRLEARLRSVNQRARPAILMSSTPLPDGKFEHRVCPLTSLGGISPESPSIRPLLRYFAVALGQTPAYPPDVPPIQLQRSSPLQKDTFIISLAFIALNGRIMPYTGDEFYRASLAPGELERLRSIVCQRHAEWDSKVEDVLEQDQEWYSHRHHYLHRINKAMAESRGSSATTTTSHQPSQPQESYDSGLEYSRAPGKQAESYSNPRQRAESRARRLIRKKIIISYKTTSHHTSSPRNQIASSSSNDEALVADSKEAIRQLIRSSLSISTPGPGTTESPPSTEPIEDRRLLDSRLSTRLKAMRFISDTPYREPKFLVYYTPPGKRTDILSKPGTRRGPHTEFTPRFMKDVHPITVPGIKSKRKLSGLGGPHVDRHGTIGGSGSGSPDGGSSAGGASP